MSNSSFFSGTAVTNNQTDAIEASKNQAASSATQAAASAVTSTAQATASAASKVASVSAKDASVVAKDASLAAKNLAVTAKDASVVAKDASLAAKDLAVAAQGQAEGFKNTASTKADEASASATTASNQATASSNSAGSSLSAKNDSVTAKDASVAARNASVTAKDAAVAAKDLSVAAKNDSVTAKDASVVARNASVVAKDASAASAATALTNKNTSVANAATATTKANEASASATASASSATTSTASKNAAVAVTANFLGAHSSAPTQTAAGGSLAVGMLYFDTGSDVLKVRASGGWINAGSSINGTSARFAYTLTANQTTVTGNDAAGNALAYDSGFADIYLNGVKLAAGDFTATSGTSIVLAAGATANDILEIVAYGTFVLNNGSFTGTTTVQNLAVTGTVDGQDVASMGSKLAGIEASATADQTKSDIEGLGIDVPAANLTGTVAAARLSTAATQAESDDSTKIATTAYVVDKITTLIGGAPTTLNDLNELAEAINDDANYNSTLTTALGTKMPKAGGAVTGNVTFGDNNKAIFGAGSDLQIYHDGSNSYINDIGTGNLLVRAADSFYLQDTGGKTYLKTVINAQTELSYNNAKKFETTNTGVDVTGALGVSVSSASISPDADADNLVIQQAGNAGITVGSATNGVGSIRFADSGSPRSGMIYYNHSGDNMRFYTAATERMRIDSNGHVGIGVSSPDGTLHVHSGSAGSIGASPQADDLVVESDTEAGITILSPDDQSARIRFSSPSTNTDVGGATIFYRQNINKMNIGTAVAGGVLGFNSGPGTENMRIDSVGNVHLLKAGANLKLYYNAAGQYATNLGWRHLQLGNNGANYIVAGNTNAGGKFYFMTNNTTDLSTNNGASSNGIQAFTIDNGGNLYSQYGTATGYGQTAGNGGLYYYNDTGSTAGSLILTNDADNGWANLYLNKFEWASGNETKIVQFNINGGAAGYIRVASASTIVYQTSSDYRLKENVVYEWDATTRLKQLKPAQFNFILDGTDVPQDGFMAHEAQAVVPIAVSGTKDAMQDEEYEVSSAVEEVVDADGNVTTEASDAVMGTRSVIAPQGIDHSMLVPLLVKTIQELEARITALEA